MMEAATSSTSINSNIIINTAATTARSSESISSATGLLPTAGLNSTPTHCRGTQLGQNTPVLTFEIQNLVF